MLLRPFDILTAEHLGFYFIGGNPSGILLPDGTKMFIVGNLNDKVKEYTLLKLDANSRKVGGTTIELKEDVVVDKKSFKYYRWSSIQHNS